MVVVTTFSFPWRPVLGNRSVAVAATVVAAAHWRLTAQSLAVVAQGGRQARRLADERAFLHLGAELAATGRYSDDTLRDVTAQACAFQQLASSLGCGARGSSSGFWTRRSRLPHRSPGRRDRQNGSGTRLTAIFGSS
jgi:hypothetical protein